MVVEVGEDRIYINRIDITYVSYIQLEMIDVLEKME